MFVNAYVALSERLHVSKADIVELTIVYASTFH